MELIFEKHSQNLVMHIVLFISETLSWKLCNYSNNTALLKKNLWNYYFGIAFRVCNAHFENPSQLFFFFSVTNFLSAMS